MTSISLTLARISGYKLMHPKEFKNQSYLPSIPELMYMTKKYIKNSTKKNKGKTIDNKF